MSSHCGRYPDCNCPPEAGFYCGMSQTEMEKIKAIRAEALQNLSASDEVAKINSLADALRDQNTIYIHNPYPPDEPQRQLTRRERRAKERKKK